MWTRYCFYLSDQSAGSAISVPTFQVEKDISTDRDDFVVLFQSDTLVLDYDKAENRVWVYVRKEGDA